jgi:hypothetical protein
MDAEQMRMKIFQLEDFLQRPDLPTALRDEKHAILDMYRRLYRDGCYETQTEARRPSDPYISFAK